MDFFNYEAGKRIGDDNVFVKLSRLVDWHRIGSVLVSTRSGMGPAGYDPVCLFRAL